MEFRSVDYFCSSIRNDFLKEINNKDNTIMYFLDNMLSHFVENDRVSVVTNALEKKITYKNKHILNYFFNRINQVASEIKETGPFTIERVKKLKSFCNELVENKDILKNFPYFNNSFIGMMLRFSQEEVWGEKLSLEYFGKYFTN